jgi:hypothetical protein
MPIKKTKKTNNKRNLILGGLVILTIILIFLSLYIIMAPTPGVEEICVSYSGYGCQNTIYNHLTGNITIRLLQVTGTTWYTANFVFVPQGTPNLNGIPNISFTSNPANTTYYTLTNSLTSRQWVHISLPVTGPVNVGTQALGSIWVEYTTATNHTTQYAQMASINIKAS